MYSKIEVLNEKQARILKTSLQLLYFELFLLKETDEYMEDLDYLFNQASAILEKSDKLIAIDQLYL